MEDMFTGGIYGFGENNDRKLAGFSAVAIDSGESKWKRILFRPVFGWGAVIRSFVRSRFSIPATSLEDGGSYLENMEQDVRKGSF